MSNENSDPITRRDMLKSMGILSAGALAAQLGMTAVTARAAESPKPLRIGLVGCGGRGTQAVKDCLDAAKIVGVTVEPYAFCDYFVEMAHLAATDYHVPAERCFGGIDGYQKLLAQPIDLVLLATTPRFRPLHVEAAIKAGKHVFMEKPVAVDPTGVRRIIAAGQEAQRKGLCIVSGTHRRHQGIYRRNQYAVANGAIGKVKGGTVAFMMGMAMMVRDREPGMSDADYLINNWWNWSMMSGDHIVEQHIHNLDVANWFIGRHPKQAIGFGGRARRQTGNQFDFFSVDFDYGEDCHIHSMSSQIPGTYDKTEEFFVGAEGTTFGNGKMESPRLASMKIPDFTTHDNPYVQEHIDLLRAIVENKPNSETEARNVAESTLTAIMGRTAAYTGKLVRWSDLMDNTASPLYNLILKPTAEDFEAGNVVMPKENVIPRPGSGADPRQNPFWRKYDEPRRNALKKG